MPPSSRDLPARAATSRGSVAASSAIVLVGGRDAHRAVVDDRPGLKIVAVADLEQARRCEPRRSGRIDLLQWREARAAVVVGVNQPVGRLRGARQGRLIRSTRRWRRGCGTRNELRRRRSRRRTRRSRGAPIPAAPTSRSAASRPRGSRSSSGCRRTPPRDPARSTVFDARGGIVVRAMKKASASVTRGSLQLVSNAGPVSGGAVPPMSVAPWQPLHDCRYSASPAVAWASV